MRKRIIAGIWIIIAIAVAIIVNTLVKRWKYLQPQKFENTIIMYDVKNENVNEAKKIQVEYSLIMKRFLPKAEGAKAIEFTGTIVIDGQEYEVRHTSELRTYYYLQLVEPSEEYVKFPDVKVGMYIMRDFSFMGIQYSDSDEYYKGPANSYEDAKNLSSPLFDDNR